MEPEKRKMRLIGMSEETHDMFLTVPWSIVHFLSGAAVKGLGWNFWTNFLLHGAYELKDQNNTDEVYNSKFNSVGDQVCSMAGFLYAKSGNTAWINAFLFGFLFAVAFRGPDRWDQQS